MPLKGDAKIERQRERRRGRRRGEAPEAPIAKLKPLTEAPVKPLLTVNQRRGALAPLTPNQEKLTELRELITNSEATQSTPSPLKEETKVKLPLYNWQAPQVGQQVILNGQVVTVPELDADGSSLSPYEGEVVSRLVSDNLFKPAFQPDLKPEKRKRRNAFK